MRVHRSLLCRVLGFALVASALVSVAAADVLDGFTVIGNPGNPVDGRYSGSPTLGPGSVPYYYQISQYEVTAAQYTEFLNAVAATDTYGLYHSGMAGTYGPKIQQNGSAGSYTYTVDPNSANRPVNFVNFWDAARFANWMHNGQPTGAQGPGTTETGAYINIGDQSTFARQSGAQFWIPNEDEWYKAAYYDPTLGGFGYWEYPTQSNTVPGRDMTEATNPGNNANYGGSPMPIDSPHYMTEAGEFELSQSYYGTFDQGGNVREWTETPYTTQRVVRGGSWEVNANQMRGEFFQLITPGTEDDVTGFRLAAYYIPEPGSAMMLLFGALAGLLWRRRRG